jgi:hypothetical protein
MRYAVYRSLKDRSLYVLHYHEHFLHVPEPLRHRGPWELFKAGEVTELLPDYQAILSERGYALIKQSIGALLLEQPSRSPREPDSGTA